MQRRASGEQVPGVAPGFGGTRRQAGGGDKGAVAVLYRELDHLQRQLREGVGEQVLPRAVGGVQRTHRLGRRAARGAGCVRRLVQAVTPPPAPRSS